MAPTPTPYQNSRTAVSSRPAKPGYDTATTKKNVSLDAARVLGFSRYAEALSFRRIAVDSFGVPLGNLLGFRELHRCQDSWQCPWPFLDSRFWSLHISHPTGPRSVSRRWSYAVPHHTMQADNPTQSHPSLGLWPKGEACMSPAPSWQ